MKVVKIIFLLLINFFLFPVYSSLFIICFFLSVTPIFSTRIARENLKNQLGIKNLRACFFITFVYLGYIFYFFEAFLFECFHLNVYLSENEFNFEDLLKEIKEKFSCEYKGIVYVLSHMANVEMYALPVLEQYHKGNHPPLYALAKPLSIPLVNVFLEWYRTRSGMRVLWTNKHIFSKMKEFIEKEKPSFCMLVDQKPKNGGIFIRFFNKFAAFPSSGLRMCLLNEMVVVYATGYRVMPGLMKLKMSCGWNAHLKKKNPLHPKDAQEQKQFITQPAELYKPHVLKESERSVAVELSYFVRWIENEIKKHPTQWCWDYKKWSREPQNSK